MIAISTADLGVIDGIASVTARIEQKLKFLRGEWFLDATAGVPWIEQILIRAPKPAIINQILTHHIRTVPDVLDVRDVTLTPDARRRTFTLDCTVSTTFGEASITVGSPPGE